MFGSLDQAQPEPANTIISMPEVEKTTDLARPTIYKRLKFYPSFPRAVPLAIQVVAVRLWASCWPRPSGLVLQRTAL